MPLAHTPCGIDLTQYFNFHSEAEGPIFALLLCLNHGVQVEACRAATPFFLNAAGSGFEVRIKP